jgi:acetyl esterase/lipase
MTKRLFQLITLLLLPLSVLPSLELPNVTAWKFSVVATEYGHWFALLALMISFVGLCSEGKSVLKVFSVLTASVSVGFFLIPTLLCATYAPSWAERVDQTFGIHSSEPSEGLDFARLFFGNSDRTIKPVTIAFRESPAKLVLDFYPASEAQSAPGGAPWVLVIHGGGWNSGDRDELPELNSYLANRGISVATISYRLAPQWIWPAPKEDAAAAVDYLKSHAKDLHIDPNRWAVFGRSAGGQIAEDLAYSIKDPSLKGLIALYAPADMNFAYQFGKEDDILHSLSLLRGYLGGNPTERAPAYSDASPIDLVQPNDVPTLLMHGEKDPLVWHRQSERLLSRLQSAGVPATLISLPWATHGFDYNINGPGGQTTSALTERFLRRVFQQ